ncbi:MAG: cytochrome P450 [Magnetococcales bacterium]|nr:cytochrome P450 [Magnetococcales bacterium]
MNPDAKVKPMMDSCSELFNPFVPGFARHPYPQLRRLRHEDPVHRSFMGMWVLTRHADIDMVLKDKEKFGSNPKYWQGYEQRYGQRQEVTWLLKHSVLNSNPPDHTRLRKALTSIFNPSQRQALAPLFTRLAQERVQAIQAAGHCFDAIRDYALPVPVQAACHLFGFPESDWEQVKAWSLQVIQLMEPIPSVPMLEDAQRGIVDFKAYLARSLDHPDGSGNFPDRFSHLVQEGSLSRDEALANLVVFFPASHETTVNLIGNGLHILLDHPRYMDWLLAHPDNMAQGVEEILRFEPPQQIAWRSVLKDCEIGGKTIRCGEQIMLFLGAANRDPSIFSEPDQFNPQRHPNPHLSFGAGVHHCIGSWFGKQQGAVALQIFLKAFPNLRRDRPDPEWLETLSFHGLRSLPVKHKL